MSPAIRFHGERRNRLGESPLWDHRVGRLYWADSIAPAICSSDAGGGDLREWLLPMAVGSIALAETGLVAALADGFYRFDPASGSCECIVRPDLGEIPVRFNDGKADRQGRFLSGTMRHDAAGGQAGRLFRLDRDGTVALLESDFALANALCFSPDGATLYFADSHEGLVRAYDYDIASGTPSNRRTLIETRSLGSVPDGATVDAEGCLWIAMVQAQKLIRVTPGGEVVGEITTPMPFPACPAFGGANLATMYVTSIGSSGSLSSDHPDAGRTVAITGLPCGGIAEAVCSFSSEATP